MAKKAKKTKRNYVRKGSPQASDAPFLRGLSDLARASEVAASRPIPKVNTETDARSQVLGVCADVLSNVTQAVSVIANCACQAPNYTDRESQQ